jgi:hypothetical protein
VNLRFLPIAVSNVQGFSKNFVTVIEYSHFPPSQTSSNGLSRLGNQCTFVPSRVRALPTGAPKRHFLEPADGIDSTSGWRNIFLRLGIDPRQQQP